MSQGDATTVVANNSNLKITSPIWILNLTVLDITEVKPLLILTLDPTITKKGAQNILLAQKARSCRSGTWKPEGKKKRYLGSYGGLLRYRREMRCVFAKSGQSAGKTSLTYEAGPSDPVSGSSSWHADEASEPPRIFECEGIFFSEERCHRSPRI